MNEVTGELNMSIIVVLIVAMLFTLFFTFIWPQIRGTFRSNSRCDHAICESSSADGRTVRCHPKNNPSQTITCVWKG